MSSAPAAVVGLVERFRNHADFYCSGQYKETDLRNEFLDPFFEALGWDVYNKKNYDPSHRQVVRETRLLVEGSSRAPDYSFRTGSQPEFFVEAKHPGHNLDKDPKPAFQLRRYAWTAKLPVSILTDFDEFCVFNTTVPPRESDKPYTSRIRYLRFEDYLTEWQWLLDTLSFEAVQRGSLRALAGDKGLRKGTARVDDAFLEDIERWRILLARNIALRNKGVKELEDLNYVVQATIDRIVFLRICEDRGIETGEPLKALLGSDSIYRALYRRFQEADERYNSGLFYFQPEKGRRERVDDISPRLKIDDAPLKEILSGLYPPKSPYEFSVMPADVLGQVYERFLGSVIRLTEGHQAKVEQKPEVRKAGGVYYTPTYIVDYIVKNTVGKLLEGKTPKDALKLRILDPACGSGSFLIGAYQHLLDWFRDWYFRDGPDKHRDVLYRAGEDDWRLLSKARKEILTSCIYGVDIDRQAVEVTKLSLLLKVLEGETAETVQTQLSAFRRRALPDLGSNIKCGNSLIGHDFFSGEQTDLFEDKGLRTRINPFDWADEFPSIIRHSERSEESSSGGFDAVIGNPPYIRVQALNEWSPESLPYFGQNYTAAGKGNYDIYVVFVEKGLSLLNRDGTLGFILPHKFFNSQYGEGLRGHISKGKHLSHVVHFGHQQVFENATTYTCLMFLSKQASPRLRLTKVEDLDDWRRGGKTKQGTIPAGDVSPAEWNFSIGPAADLLVRLGRIPTKLSDVTSRIFQGVKTSADKIYIVEERERKGKRVRVYSPQLDRECWLEPDLLHPLIKGGDSKRFSLTRTDRLILFPYAASGGAVELVPADELQGRYPLTWRYLEANKDYLAGREDGRMRGPRWYGYIYPKALDVMHLPKLFTPDLAVNASFSLDESGEVFFTGGVAGGYGLLVRPELSREYILGLLNSRLLDWRVKQTASMMRGGWYSFESRFIRDLPIRTCNLADKTDKAQHDKMVGLVEKMLDMHKRLHKAKSRADKEALDRQIAATDRLIDQLVYELYGLTEEEIRLVEGGSR